MVHLRALILPICALILRILSNDPFVQRIWRRAQAALARFVAPFREAVTLLRVGLAGFIKLGRMALARIVELGHYFAEELRNQRRDFEEEVRFLRHRRNRSERERNQRLEEEVRIMRHLRDRDAREVGMY